MSQEHKDAVKPLAKREAEMLEAIINSEEPVVIDPELGVTGNAPLKTLTENDQAMGLSRYTRHYAVVHR